VREPGFELRLLEAILFAATEPLGEAALAERLPEGCDVPALLAELAADYEGRGIRLAKLGGRWAFRTAEDLAQHMRIELPVGRKLSRAAVETLAIIAYHQPVTRTEVEEIRGVMVSRGTFDVLLDAGWIRPLGRRQTPGRPVTWGTSHDFLEHFGLDSLSDLPGVDELKAAGLLDTRPAATVVSDRPGARRQVEDTAAPESGEGEPDLFEPEPEPSEAEEGQSQ
jgi:segregation and condensation protein B